MFHPEPGQFLMRRSLRFDPLLGSAIICATLFFSLETFAQPSCTPVPSGITAWWRAEDNAADSVNNNNGTFFGTAYTNGEVGQAFNFEGINFGVGYVQVPDSGTLHFTNTMTVECWINVGNYSAPFTYSYGLVSKDAFTLDLNTSTQVPRFNVASSNNTASIQVLGANPVPANQWVHLAATVDGTNVNLYVNGALAGSVPWTQGIFPSTDPLTIGAEAINPIAVESVFNGQVDEVSLYDRALTPDEIAAIYNAGSEGKCFVPTLPTFTQEPTNQAVLGGTTASFSVATAGSGPQYYQWQLNGTNLSDGGSISGSATPNLVVSDISSNDVGTYDIVITNIAGTAISSNASLTLMPSIPVIVIQPENQRVDVGQTATFTVATVGTTPYFYQWILDGTNIAGATNQTLTIADVQPDQSGSIYSVQVTNALGFTNSSNVTLSVFTCTPPPSGIVGWWLAEGNANDIIGGNNGNASNVTYAAGEVGQAFVFNGTNSTISVPADTNLDVGALSSGSGFTIEGWILPTSSGGPIAVWDSTKEPGLQLWVSGSALYGRLSQNIVSTPFQTGSVLNFTNFQHVAMTYDRNSGYVVIYVNGVSVFSQNLGNAPVWTTYPNFNLNIGWSSFFHAYYSGRIDELSIYSRVLSSNEIAAIYNANGGKCPDGIPPTITTQPTNQNTFVGGSASFSVAVSGSSPIAYQWYDSSGSISSATNSTLTLSNVQSSAAGSYYVMVSNPSGSTNSASAILTVTQPTLDVSYATGNSVLSWPVSTGGFTLQAADSLTPPVLWTNVPLTLQTNGANVQVTVPMTNTQTFFRLYSGP